jgi:nucleoid DNA-binding protein
MHTRDRGQPAGNLLPAWQAGAEFGFTEMRNCLEVLISKVRTGKSIGLPPEKAVTFKCSGVLRTAMDGEGD